MNVFRKEAIGRRKRPQSWESFTLGISTISFFFLAAAGPQTPKIAPTTSANASTVPQIAPTAVPMATAPVAPATKPAPERKAFSAAKAEQARNQAKKDWVSQLSKPRVDYNWITVKGELRKFEWQITSQWLWESKLPAQAAENDIGTASPGDTTPNFNEGTDPPEHPVLRTWVEIPANYTYQATAHASDDRPVKLNRTPTDIPFKRRSGNILAIDMTSPSVTITLSLKQREGRSQDFTLLIQPIADQPLFWIQQSCANLGIRVERTRDIDAKFLYAAMSCRDVGDALELFFFRSSEATWRTTSFKSKLAEGKDWVSYRYPKPDEAPVTPKFIGSFRLGEVKGEGTSDNWVYYLPPKPIPLFAFSVGLGATLINYHESGTGVSMTETGLTGKVNAFYNIIPGKMDLGANAFMTLLPLTISPSHTPEARFYGANARIGLALPGTPSSVQWSLLGGWYFWAMSVPGNVYGIQFLSGPQIFILMRSPLGVRPYAIYFKFAPIAESLSTTSFSNREVAVGATYRVNSLKAKSAWSLTLDISNTSFTSSDNLDSMGLTTVSLGIQMGF